MGCAGSKPHHLLSSTIKEHHPHHVNSPQKGFILFNAKTIEYLKANENEIRQKLVQRCELKISKSIGRSTSRSIINSARRTLLPNSNTEIQVGNEDSKNLDIDKNTVTLPRNFNSSSSDSKIKIECIDAAVDYVLKYAINDFDIENFKSSNHLSMKQIRKDIMKKHQNKNSSSKLDTSNVESKTLTLQASKGFSASYYKNALNVAIDEFGLFIQENFIIINEFENKNKIEKEEKKEEIVNENETKDSVESEPSSQSSEEDALKLKEALELARQNFYKGKMSMVCLNKKGGYVVKEVAEQNENKKEDILNTSIVSNDLKEELNENETTAPRINIEYIENKDKKSVSNASVKSLKINEQEEQEKLDSSNLVAEFLKENSQNSQMINSIIELIVKYSTKSANENSNSIDTYLEKVLNSTSFNEIESLFEEISSSDNDQIIDLLKIDFEKVKNIAELIQQVEEKDYGLIDEKLVQSIINFDYVNREFTTYLSILENTLEQQLEKLNSKICELGVNGNEEVLNKLIKFKDDKIVNYLEKNSQVRKYAEEIHIRVQNLPKKIFRIDEKTIETQVEPLEVETEKNVQDVEIKKEIAISILNVGEVLAKTVDHYTLENNCQAETTEDNLETVEPSSHTEDEKIIEKESDVLTVDTTEEQVKNEEENSKNPKSQESLASTLTSPSFSSSSSMSPSGSISNEPSKQTESIEEANFPRADYELIEQARKDSVKDEIANLVEEMSLNINSHLNNLDEYEVNSEVKQQHKSSSSSSDIISSNDESNILVQQFISNIIETTEQNLGADGVRKMEKRMSLDEELLNQLDDVEKKVKYMNETCSENDENDDDDNDLDDENFDYDESLDNETDERLFHPRRPNKIKSEIRQNRAMDLQEEIKQISNVIQDLVQTINVRNNNEESVKNETLNESKNQLSSKKSSSNIPVRQKILTKQKATDDEACELENSTVNQSIVFETSVDLSSISNKNESINLSNTSTPDRPIQKVKKNSSKSKFKSKLPVRK
ncbi:unnamed protein product [Brachionus calyciflorus]|uniref:Uncharacterized protein n=1 Tax=Brachionus calyciflorus TaxID=104777 RepID=A0A813M576_9BILA|nr:unnamed protein product [Brachionus calyciflorus]